LAHTGLKAGATRQDGACRRAEEEMGTDRCVLHRACIQLEQQCNRRSLTLSCGIFIAALGCVLAVQPATAAAAPAKSGGQSAAALNWQSPAHWRHGLSKTVGTLALTGPGLEFQPVKGSALRWSFLEIQTFELSPHRLTLVGYENRRWHLHGEREFHFDLPSAVPPAVAAELAAHVAKPAENGAPDPKADAFVTLGARHRTRGGGTNGALRFRDTGIDYVTASGEGARSWRWADIQTVANPDPYHFRVGAYRGTFEFELKQAMSHDLFDRLWNEVYARDLSVVNPNGGARP
jgi:hypothetical protein